MTLNQLNVGQSARIVGITADHPNATQLCEMGLIPGETVALTGKAPFGDPIQIQIMGYTLCLRNKDAAAIGVELSTEPSRK